MVTDSLLLMEKIYFYSFVSVHKIKRGGDSMKVKINMHTAYYIVMTIVIFLGCMIGIWLGQKENAVFDKSFDVISNNMVAVAEAKEIPIYFVETEEKKLAISFDAAWGCEHTQDILDVLAQYDITATFFLTNIWLNEYPDMAKQIADAGHEIAMHSVSHPHMPEISTTQIEQELKDNYDLIVETTHFKPELFRFPFGDYDNKSIGIVRENGFYPIQWSIDTLDT